MRNDWVSVDERLPHPDGLVVWWSRWDGAPVIAPACRDPKAWTYTHWKPLPAAPRGEAYTEERDAQQSEG